MSKGMYGTGMATKLKHNKDEFDFDEKYEEYYVSKFEKPDEQWAALYTRKSMNSDKSESIENQKKWCEIECERRGWTSLKEYSDPDKSGKNMKRPGFERMLKDIKAGRIHTIIFYRYDRLSRDLLDFLQFSQELEVLGVSLLSITEDIDTTTPNGKAMLRMMLVFAQNERETTSVRVRHSSFFRARNGKRYGRMPFGYMTEDLMIGGKRTGKVLLDPERADIVKMIFDEYIRDGGSTLSVVRMLKNMGVSSRYSDEYMTTSTISKLLRNPFYAQSDAAMLEYLSKNFQIEDRNAFDGLHGCLTYGKRKATKFGNEKNKNKKEWVAAAGVHDYLITSKVWLQAQAKLDKNKTKGSAGTSSKTLLTGLLVCPTCGSIMTMVSNKKGENEYRAFLCQKGKELKEHHIVRIDERKMLEGVLEIIRGLFKERVGFEQIIKDEIKRLQADKGTTVVKKRDFDTEVRKIDEAIANAGVQLAMGNMKQEAYDLTIGKLEEMRSDVMADLQASAAFERELTYKEADFKEVLKTLDDLGNIDAVHDFATKKALIRSVIDHINVKEVNGEIEAEVVLDFPLGTSTPFRNGDIVGNFTVYGSPYDANISLRRSVYIKVISNSITVAGVSFNGVLIKDMPENTLGERLRKKRYELGIGPDEAAEIIGVNWKASILSWEAGRTTPEDRNLFIVERFINGLPIDDEMFDDMPENNHVEKLTKYIYKNNITIEEMCLMVGITSHAYRKWRNGKSCPDNCSKQLIDQFLSGKVVDASSVSRYVLFNFMPEETFCDKVKKIRRILDITKDEMGAKLGVSKNSVKAWEDGRNNPKPEYVQKVDQMLNEIKAEPARMYDSIMKELEMA